MSTSEIDIDALLGGGSDSDDGLSVSDVDEDDPSLAAELNAMQGGTSAAASGPSRADELRARVGALQQEASKLKAAGDIPAALAKMREAKAANDELMALQEAPAPAPAPAASSSPGPARTPTLSRRGMTLAQLDERIKELQTAAVMDNRRGDTEGAVAKFREAKALQQQRAKLADGMSDSRSTLTQPFHSACTGIADTRPALLVRNRGERSSPATAGRGQGRQSGRRQRQSRGVVSAVQSRCSYKQWWGANPTTVAACLTATSGTVCS